MNAEAQTHSEITSLLNELPLEMLQLVEQFVMFLLEQERQGNKITVIPEKTSNAYQAGEISLGKAAEMIGVSQEEMKDILREDGAEIHLGPQTIDELLEDARHA